MTDRALWAFPLVLGGALGLAGCDAVDAELGDEAVGPSFGHRIDGRAWTVTTDCAEADPPFRVTERLALRATGDPAVYDVVAARAEDGFATEVVGPDVLAWTRVDDGGSTWSGSYTFREDGTFAARSRRDDLEPPAVGEVDCAGEATPAP